jgi:asparagine synthase (glutamine-hydrolysing)
LVHHQDEPIADPVCVPLLHLARLTKSEGVTVVQIGEGSDEIFLGYSIYARVLRFASGLRRATAIVPLPALRGAAAALRPFVGGLQGEFVTEALRRGIPPAHGIAGLAERDKAMILRGWSGYSTAHDYLYERFGSGWSDDEVARVSRDHELQLRLAELLLMRVDKMTMAASVEARAPYLDHELVELALGLPLPVLFRDGTGKLALRRALEGLVPDAVLSRRKQGFGAPVWRWLDALGPRVEDELVRAPVSEHLDPMVVRAFLQGPRTPRRAFELWTLLNFALWHRHWIEGEDLRDARPLAAGIAA